MKAQFGGKRLNIFPALSQIQGQDTYWRPGPKRSGGRSHNLAPGFESLASHCAMFVCGDQVATSVEMIIESGMDGQKALR